MKHIPNLFTLLNLVFGCFAIVFTLQNGIVLVEDQRGSQWIQMPEKIWLAALFIGLAAVVDFLDGFVARLFKASSEMGKQLDSLADVVSFGVAPGMILYQFLRMAYVQETGALDLPVWMLAVAFLIPVAAAWRLATFNLDTTQTYSFRGVPTPAVGLLVASFPLIYWNATEAWVRDYFLLNKWVLLLVILALSWLMVSRIPILSMKFKDFKLASNLPRLILAGIAVISIIFLGWMAVPVIFLAYVLVSLLFKNQIA